MNIRGIAVKSSFLAAMAALVALVAGLWRPAVPQAACADVGWDFVSVGHR